MQLNYKQIILKFTFIKDYPELKKINMTLLFKILNRLQNWEVKIQEYIMELDNLTDY